MQRQSSREKWSSSPHAQHAGWLIFKNIHLYLSIPWKTNWQKGHIKSYYTRIVPQMFTLGCSWHSCYPKVQPGRLHGGWPVPGPGVLQWSDAFLARPLDTLLVSLVILLLRWESLARIHGPLDSVTPLSVNFVKCGKTVTYLGQKLKRMICCFAVYRTFWSICFSNTLTIAKVNFVIFCITSKWLNVSNGCMEQQYIARNSDQCKLYEMYFDKHWARKLTRRNNL